MNSVQFLESNVQMPLMNLHVRSTLITLSGASILISPGSCLNEIELQKLDKITDLVAPNLFHCGGIEKVSSLFPDAKKWGPRNAQKYKSNISWTDELTEEKWPFDNELALIQLFGMPRVEEAVFFHKESKSIVVADLCFNIVKSNGFGSWLILNLFGTYNKLGVSRFFTKFIENKKLFEESLQKIFSYDFENIIVSHGDNLIGNGKNKLKVALSDRGFRF